MILYQIEYPGLRHEPLIRSLKSGQYKAVVIEGYHSGTAHVCTGEEPPNCPYNIIPFLEFARKIRVPVFLIFGHFVGDEDNKHGYKPFDEGIAGAYTTSNKMVKSGIVPLKANEQQFSTVLQRLEEILNSTTDYYTVIREMYESFPFQATLGEIRASAR